MKKQWTLGLILAIAAGTGYVAGGLDHPALALAAEKSDKKAASAAERMS